MYMCWEICDKNAFLFIFTNILSLTADIRYIDILVLGDFNFDLITYNDKFVEFIALMYSFSLFPVISRSTRVTGTTATLIDHI